MALSLAAPVLGAPVARAEDAAARLCRSNPAYSADVMGKVLQEQMDRDHDPALDKESPEQLAAEAVEQGVKDCATELDHAPALFAVLAALPPGELAIGWDAFNTSCADHGATKAECVRAEVAAERALKHMVAADQPPGARALVQTCELVLKGDPAMAEWRECVDLGLAPHADAQNLARCKTLVAWHATSSGAAAGQSIAACLRGK